MNAPWLQWDMDSVVDSLVYNVFSFYNASGYFVFRTHSLLSQFLK